MTRAAPNRSALVGVIGATLVSGGGGIALFNEVMGHVMNQQAAHIETLERALEDCTRVSDRCDSRLMGCQERLRDARGSGAP
jgi:hypothetical protein